MATARNFNADVSSISPPSEPAANCKLSHTPFFLILPSQQDIIDETCLTLGLVFFFLFFWDTGERYYQFEDIWFSCLIFTTNQKHNCGVLLQVRNCHLYQGSQTFFGGSPRTVIYRLMTTHHTREQKTFRGQSLCLLTEGEWTSTLERIKRQLVNP